jgi:hypothetical protein
LRQLQVVYATFASDSPQGRLKDSVKKFPRKPLKSGSRTEKIGTSPFLKRCLDEVRFFKTTKRKTVSRVLFTTYPRMEASMLKKLLLTTALSGLMLSSAMAQSSPDAMKSDASKSPASMNSGASTLSSQSPDQLLASNVKGADVLGSDNQKIGDISDILFTKDGKIDAYLLSVGGFLGVGAKEVALAPSQVQLTQDNNTWKAKVSMTKDQLAQAPNFERHKDKATTTGSAGTGAKPRSTMGDSAPATPPARQ